MNAIKKVNKKDFFEIIKINEAAIPAVNSVTESEFEWFFEHALYFKKVLNFDKIIGFLLVLPAKLNYKSLNYQWFSNHYNNFAYIDRIVIIQSYKNNGIGTSLYLDLEQSLDQTIPLIGCEFNLKPANKESKNFHLKLNYENVGTQFTENNRKQVSLMIKRLHV